MLEREFETGGFVQYLVKDLGIALDESLRMGLSLPSAALVNQFYQALIA